MKRSFIFLCILLLLSLACNRSARTPAQPTTAAPASIPAEYQVTYDELTASLNSFTAALPPGKNQPLSLGAELSYANANIGEMLLEKETMTLVQKQLDALKSLGVKVVVVAIKFPMLEADFSRSAEYLDFYKQVAQEIHSRDMKFLVEVGPAFSGTIYSPLKVDWSKYDKDSFIAAQQNELVTIANEVQPDYLQIADEPKTIAMLSGVKLTPEEYAAFIQSSVDKIGHPHGLKLGAGSGTWEDPAYMDNLMGINGLDCIDIHIYPIGRDANLLKRAYDVALKARQNGKCVAISEAWLYKVNAAEQALLAANFETVYSRDAFSFWEPVDESFITAVTRLAQSSGAELVSFFWTRSFFASLDYEQARNLSPQQMNRELNQAALANLKSGTFSPLGDFFKTLIGQQP
jgi:hypothetical protein